MDYTRTTVLKNTNLVNEIQEGSWQLDFLHKRSFILVSLIFFELWVNESFYGSSN